MKRLASGILLAAFCGFSAPLLAAEMSGDGEKDRVRMIVKEVLREYAAVLGDRSADPVAKETMRDLVQNNKAFMKSHPAGHFGHFLNAQHPRATVVTCSDSRVHTHALDDDPDGDLFMIRNIGNQIATAEGSVEYGVHHLHTPVLLILGHSACGAIKAASGDYSGESGPIRNELDTIQITKGDAGMNSIKKNVHNQVKHAMGKWEEDVLTGKLTVVGAVYDFRNDLNQGMGKMVVINVNGETDARRIAAMDLMKAAEVPMPAKRRSSSHSAPAAAHH